MSAPTQNGNGKLPSNGSSTEEKTPFLIGVAGGTASGKVKFGVVQQRVIK